MKIKPFKLERYFAEHEFSAPYLLSCSDCEPLSQKALLSMANPASEKLWNDLVFAYTHSQGNPLLREEISGLYEKIDMDDLVVLAPEEGIFIAINLLINKGDHLITTYPAYQSLYEIANSLGADVSKWKASKNGKFELDTLFSLVKDNTRLLIINFPHNPTGETIGTETLNEIILFARERQLIIFSDEMYRFLEYQPNNRLPSVCDEYELGVSLCGMSKSFSLPGLRIGWLASRNKALINKIIGFKDYTTICPSAPSEILAMIALQNKGMILEKNIEIIQKNIDLFEKFVGRHHKHIKWRKPVAGPVSFPEFNLKTDIDQFCKALIEKKGLMLLPASKIDLKSNNVRIGLGRKNFELALNKLEEYILEFSTQIL